MVASANMFCIAIGYENKANMKASNTTARVTKVPFRFFEIRNKVLIFVSILKLRQKH